VRPAARRRTRRFARRDPARFSQFLIVLLGGDPLLVPVRRRRGVAVHGDGGDVGALQLFVHVGEWVALELLPVRQHLVQ
jgi:hypothetical protein